MAVASHCTHPTLGRQKDLFFEFFGTSEMNLVLGYGCFLEHLDRQNLVRDVLLGLPHNRKSSFTDLGLELIFYLIVKPKFGCFQAVMSHSGSENADGQDSDVSDSVQQGQSISMGQISTM